MADRKFENREMQKRYDESRPKPEEHDEPDGDETPDGEEKPIEDVVDEHGPADEVEIHSKHGKHTHKSRHHDAEEAKAHIDKAMGGGEESAMGGGEGEEEMGGGGGGMPTMRG
jgi:hypothetical protein